MFLRSIKEASVKNKSNSIRKKQQDNKKHWKLKFKICKWGLIVMI